MHGCHQEIFLVGKGARFLAGKSFVHIILCAKGNTCNFCKFSACKTKLRAFITGQDIKSPIFLSRLSTFFTKFRCVNASAEGASEKLMVF